MTERNEVITGHGGVEPTIVARRAIEALRAGVPSRDAVAALGSGQSAIEDRFLALCAGAAGGTAGGLLLGGGFGAGKSHLLEHLAQIAAFLRKRIAVAHRAFLVGLRFDQARCLQVRRDLG